MGINRKVVHKLDDGSVIEAFELIQNNESLKVTVLTYGATVQSVILKGKDGVERDVILGFDNPADYTGDHPFFGCTVGRVANRIKNAKFTLDEVEYEVSMNRPPHCLHGGFKG